MEKSETNLQKTKFTVRFPPNLRSRLDRLAKKREITLTALIIELLRQQLEILGEKE